MKYFLIMSLFIFSSCGYPTKFESKPKDEQLIGNWTQFDNVIHYPNDSTHTVHIDTSRYSAVDKYCCDNKFERFLLLYSPDSSINIFDNEYLINGDTLIRYFYHTETVGIDTHQYIILNDTLSLISEPNMEGRITHYRHVRLSDQRLEQIREEFE